MAGAEDPTAAVVVFMAGAEVFALAERFMVVVVDSAAAEERFVEEQADFVADGRLAAAEDLVVGRNAVDSHSEALAAEVANLVAGARAWDGTFRA